MSTYLITRPTLGVRRPVALAPRRTVGVVPAVLAAPAVDLTREGEDGLVTVEAPGLDPVADLTVSVTGDRLTVAGVRRSTGAGAAREARFSRTLALPEGVDQDAVSADYSAGVLRVRVVGMFPAPVRPQTHAVAITSDVARSEAPAEVEAADDEQAPAEQGSGSDQQQAEAPAAA